MPAADFAYVHVVRGALLLDGEELGPGDAARLTGTEGLALAATTDAEVLIWEMRDWRKALG